MTQGVLNRKGNVLKVDRSAFLDLLQCSLRALELLDRNGDHIHQFSAGELCEALSPFEDHFEAARGSEDTTQPRDDDPWPPDVDEYIRTGSPYAADPMPESAFCEIALRAYKTAASVLFGILFLALITAAAAYTLSLSQTDATTQTETQQCE